MKDIIPLFCEIDDFILAFEKYQKKKQLPSATDSEKRGRPRSMCLSEIMTILVHFHQSGYYTFKEYYIKHVCQHLQWAFPNLVSYNRFVALMPEALLALSLYLYLRFGICDGISFVDSTVLRVCHNKRISSHRVFAEQAAHGKNSLGWFYGFKLHLLINTQGDLLGITFTPGNTDDRQPVMKLTHNVFGKLYADKGYISQALRQTLQNQDVDLVYKVRKNMKSAPLSDFDSEMLKRRMLIEVVIGELKSGTCLDHTRHRSFVNFQVNMVSALIAYTHHEKKPSLKRYSYKEIHNGFQMIQGGFQMIQNS